MHVKTKVFFLSSLAAVSFLLLFQNCSETSFSKVAPEQKAQTLTNTEVFDELPKVSPPPDPTVSIPVKNICSNWGGKLVKSSVLDSEGLKAVMKEVGNPDNSCETNDSEKLKDDILAGRKIVFPDCDMKGGEEVEISLTNNENKQLMIIERPNTVQDPGPKKRVLSMITGEKGITGEMDKDFKPIAVLSIGVNKGSAAGMPTYKPLPKTSVSSYNKIKFAMSNIGKSATSEEEESEEIVPCDAYRSPLVIDFRPAAVAERSFFLDLTAPWEGLLFDILGQMAPVPHEKSMISWFKNHSAGKYFNFLTLPNSAGEVKGIDQLFGNNTMGPKGQIASHGFQALTKYDGLGSRGVDKSLQDGYIDASDPVYKHLRLWADFNLDAEAQPNELISLEDAGVEVIDLNYDTSFFERDRYGNEARFKSVVKMKDGSLHPMFDLWFRQ